MRQNVIAIAIILTIGLGASGARAAESDLYNPLPISATNMPVGSIILWPTDNDLKTANGSEEWMICDGREIPEGEYTTLYTLVGNTFGDGPNGTTDHPTFNIPDLRGMFVRGTNTAGKMRTKKEPFYDPNAAGRVQMQRGGKTGDNVGSIQRDEFRQHRHDISMSKIPTQSKGDWIFSMNGNEHDHTRYTGGNETRPVNAYLNYLIRVK